MGCCFVSETKDDFKGFRIIKDQRQKFGLKEISNQNSKNQNNENKRNQNSINQQNIKIQNPRLKLLSIPKNINTQINRYPNIKINQNNNNKNNQNQINYTEKLLYSNPLCETREFYTHNDFIKGEIKGKGRFGIVYCGLSSNSGEIVAIKIYDNISNLKVEKICEKIKDLYYLNHPNLIRAIPLIDSSNLINFNGKKTLSIIYEISNGDNLKDLINKFGELSEVIIQKYTFDILQGLQYLHSRNIIHKNIKNSNILVDSNGTIRISDSLIDSIILGDGKEIYDNIINGNNLLNDKDKNINIDFNIPNFFIQNCKNQNFEINQSYDLWCLGCIIIECFTGKNPYSEKKFNDQNDFINFLYKNPNLIPQIPNKLSNQCKQLLNILFDYKQTSQKDIYNKLFNLDFFKMNNKNLNLTNSLDKSSSIKGSSITVNNIFNVNVNKKRKNSNLGQKLQKFQVVNVLNSNDNPTFSITVSGVSSRNSNFFLNQSQKSSFLYQSNLKGKNYNNNNNNLGMDEVPEANVEQSPITIKDNEKNIYNFDEDNLIVKKSDLEE